MAARKGFELFVSRIPWTVGARELREHFTKFGQVRNCRIAFDDSTGFSKGFGFVSYSNPKGVQAALQNDVHVIDGQKMNVQAKHENSPSVRKLQITDLVENGH